MTIYQSAPVLGVGFANFPVAFTSDLIRLADAPLALSEAGRAPHNVVIGTLVELGPVGLLLLALFLGPLVVRRGWGAEATTIRATMASLMTMALFLDVVANRKQVWLVIGLAAGLAYVARRETQACAATDPPPDDRGAIADRTSGVYEAQDTRLRSTTVNSHTLS